MNKIDSNIFIYFFEVPIFKVSNLNFQELKDYLKTSYFSNSFNRYSYSFNQC